MRERHLWPVLCEQELENGKKGPPSQAEVR